MRISVVICTWNRCALLRRTLESLRSLIVPAGREWELLVVNNRSTDATDEVIAAYQQFLPLRRLFEPELGLSRARNAAVRAANGDLVLFTDDDVRVDPSWMKAYVEAVHRWPDAGYLAGAIRPDFDADVPRWVRHNQGILAGMLCLRDAGSVSRTLGPEEFPYGPNMAVRREALALAPFDERFGRKGDEQVRGSETSLFRSLQQRGVRGIWVPEAMIHHYVPLRRATRRYLWDYYHGCGRTQARLTYESQSRRQLLTPGLRTLARICIGPWDWCRHLTTLAHLSGQFSELGQLGHRGAELESEGEGR
jgi:glycosyltransferase involved in cell wall biosynthesis